MTQIPYMTPDVRAFDDRRTMLLVMGILLIVLGAVGGCLTLAAPIGLFIPTPAKVERPRVQDVIGGVVVLGTLTTLVVWTGIGSILKRRWVRPVVISCSSIALVIGVISVATAVFSVSDIQASMATVP